MKKIIKLIKAQNEKLIRVKKGTATALQYKAMITLLVVAFLAFLLSALAEFGKINFLCHQDYFINLCLGIAASALISFLAILVPFLKEKSETKKSFEVITKKALINLYFLMHIESIDNIDDDCESIKLLAESITDFNNFYENINFTSKRFDKISKQINKDIPKIVSQFKLDCDALDKNFIKICSKETFGEEEYKEVIEQVHDYILDTFQKEFTFPFEISDYDISREFECRILSKQKPFFDHIDDMTNELFAGLTAQRIRCITLEVSANKIEKNIQKQKALYTEATKPKEEKE
ncbi:MAG: hypothetical protein IJA02_08985 [Clostridia bacterium]|nr:hypothetical protein [Clostridia bacterium]